MNQLLEAKIFGGEGMFLHSTLDYSVHGVEPVFLFCGAQKVVNTLLTKLLKKIGCDGRLIGEQLFC